MANDLLNPRRNPFLPQIFRRDRLRAWRVFRGMTLQELGRAAGLSHTYISRLELGRRPTPSLRVILALARGLNIPHHELWRDIQS
jgi:transcriptional regulator with XRE-family HTH domain